MKFPQTIEEFIKDYSFKDKEEVYTNGSDLIQVYRVEQALEHYKKEIRAKAIDEFAEALVKHTHKIPSRCLGGANVLKIAEQMKAGGENE